MKQLIFTAPQTIPTISIGEISDTSHIGFINPSTKEKGYIAYIGDNFKRICAYGNGDYYCNNAYNGSEVFNSIQDAIVKKESWNYEYFVFNTRKELYKWLSE